MKTKRHKALPVLAKVFLRLFFARNRVLTIGEVIAEFRFGGDEIKSQTRRLYDIANVLMALGVIERLKYRLPTVKRNAKECRNAYRWVGSEGFNLCFEEPVTATAKHDSRPNSQGSGSKPIGTKTTGPRLVLPKLRPDSQQHGLLRELQGLIDRPKQSQKVRIVEDS